MLAPVFTDHAVLQRGQPIRVWGAAKPGEAVELSLGEAKASATADAEGRWSATFPAREPGAALTLTAQAGGERQTISDLLVGDVWLCSGQSNMEYPLRRSLGGEAEAANSADPNIRLLQTGRTSLPTPTTALPKEAAWRAATPGVGQQLQRRLLLHGARDQEDHRRSDRPDRRHLGRVGDPGLDQPRRAARPGRL
jgi:sialate O-acetylesterase